MEKKVKLRILQSLVAILGVIAFTPALCWAQAEINPDHFDSIPGVPTNANKAAADRAYGSFFLPFEIQCAGVKLTPGSYSLSIRQLGRQEIVRLRPVASGARGHALEVTATPQVSPEPSNGLLINRTSQRRTLTAIRLGQVGVTLFLHTGRVSMHADSMHTELIPVSLSASRAFAAIGN